MIEVMDTSLTNMRAKDVEFSLDLLTCKLSMKQASQWKRVPHSVADSKNPADFNLGSNRAVCR